MRKKPHGPMLILFGAVLLLCGALFWLNRPVVFYAACRMGLPNLSRPAELSADDVGCTIFRDKNAYVGMLFSGRHGMSFHPEKGEAAAFHCLMSGCGPAVESQLDVPPISACPHSWGRDGIAYVHVEGWQSSFPRHFGHLSAFPTEFYATRFVKIDSPPTTFIKKIEQKLKSHGACN